MSKCDSRQSHFEVRAELVLRQIALETLPLFSLGIKNEHRRCPKGIKSVKAYRIFLDMNFERNEVAVDEVGSIRVGVRFGFQPSACPSGGCGAKVHEQRLTAGLRLRQRGIGIFLPVN